MYIYIHILWQASMWQVSRDSDPQRGDEDVSPSPGPIDDTDGAATQSHGVGDVA